MNDAYLVISIATTGLPKDGYMPAILEIAAVLVLPGVGSARGSAGSPGVFSSLVYQPDEIALSREASEAVRFHGISVEETRGALPEDRVKESFEAWRKGLTTILFDEGYVLRGWRGFNREFLATVLHANGWREVIGDFGVPGPCVMNEAATLFWDRGWNTMRRDGTYTPISFPRVIGALRKEGYSIPAENPGRALEKAIQVGRVCVALKEERAKFPANVIPFEAAPLDAMT